MSLSADFVRSAATHGLRAALRTADGTSMTYGELDASRAHMAGLTAARIEPGDRVGLMLPNVPEFGVVYFGVLRAGGVVVPMNPLLRAREVAHYVGDSGTKAVFTFPFSVEAVKAGVPESCAVTVVDAVFADLIAGAQPRSEVAARGPDDTAVIPYTYGTTGSPEGRGADPRQPAQERRGDQPGLGPDQAARRALWRPAAVSLLRPDLRPQRRPADRSRSPCWHASTPRRRSTCSATTA